MRKRIIGAILGIVAVGAVLGACNTSTNQQAVRNDSVNSANALHQLQQAQPTPFYNWSQIRQTLISVENAQAHNVQTTTFFFNMGVADPVQSCPSIGLPVASDTQLTNPTEADPNNSAVAISQPDPTGVYSGASTGTYVVCVNADGTNYINYWEGFVQTVTGPAVWNAQTHQVQMTGPSSVSVKTSK